VPQPPNPQINKKVTGLSEVAGALRQGNRYHVTRLTIIKSFCAEPEAAAAFALFLVPHHQRIETTAEPARDSQGREKRGRGSDSPLVTENRRAEDAPFGDADVSRRSGGHRPRRPRGRAKDKAEVLSFAVPGPRPTDPIELSPARDAGLGASDRPRPLLRLEFEPHSPITGSVEVSRSPGFLVLDNRSRMRFPESATRRRVSRRENAAKLGPEPSSLFFTPLLSVAPHGRHRPACLTLPGCRRRIFRRDWRAGGPVGDGTEADAVTGNAASRKPTPPKPYAGEPPQSATESEQPRRKRR
jgi:hypothetical protein